MPAYADDRGRNPVLLRRAAFGLVDEATGDRGLGPSSPPTRSSSPRSPVAGANPDVDTPADLARAVEAAWAPASAPTASRSSGSARSPTAPTSTRRSARSSAPTRPGPTTRCSTRCSRSSRSGETWLDIGAGAGRFALPIARALDRRAAVDRPRRVAVDARAPARDRRGLRHRERAGRRGPLAAGRPERGRRLEADVALIAHVGYDVEAIGPFLDALEAAAAALCVAVLMERGPAVGRRPVLAARPRRGAGRAAGAARLPRAAPGARPPAGVTRIAVEPRRFESRDALEGFVRRQLWIDPAGPKEGRFQAALDELAVDDGEGWTIRAAAERRRGRHLVPTMSARRGRADSIPPDFFLAGYPDETRRRERLRAVVKGAVPDVIERVRAGWRMIGYDVPVGRRDVYFAWVMPERSTSTSAGSTASSWPIPSAGSRALTCAWSRPARHIRPGRRDPATG